MHRWVGLAAAMALVLAGCSDSGGGGNAMQEGAQRSEARATASSSAPRPGTQNYDTLAELHAAVVAAGAPCGELVEELNTSPATALGRCAIPNGDLVLRLYADATTRISDAKALREAHGDGSHCYIAGRGYKSDGAWLIDSTVDESLCRTLSSALPGDLDQFTPPPNFTFECFEQVYSGPTPKFAALADVWTATAATPFSDCTAEVRQGYTPTPNDLAAVDAYRQFVPAETPEGALKVMLAICAESGASEEEVLRWQPTVVRGAALLCPTAPHIALLQARGDAALVDDGTYVVGQTISPGTWRTDPGIRDCYWERTSGSGEVLDNMFVNFAPDGASVTIRGSDGGFVSNGCGIWRRVA